jgi:hypothetical protein
MQLHQRVLMHKFQQAVVAPVDLLPVESLSSHFCLYFANNAAVAVHQCMRPNKKKYAPNGMVPIDSLADVRCGVPTLGTLPIFVILMHHQCSHGMGRHLRRHWPDERSLQFFKPKIEFFKRIKSSL